MAADGPSFPPLPPPPKGDYFDETQWAVLVSLLDAIIPSITPASSVTDDQIKTHRIVDDDELAKLAAQVQATVVSPPSADVLKAYLEDRFSANPVLMDDLRRTFENIPESGRNKLGGALSALATRPGSLLLTGSSVPVHERTLAEREAVLQRWANSWFTATRILYKTFSSLGKVIWLKASSAATEGLGFPALPPNWEPPKPCYEFDFLQFPAGDEPAVIETDVVIVGSGPGGGVSAKVLAEEGHKVLVVDKGYYYPPERLPMSQEAATHHMFENSGFVGSIDNSVNAAAGSCWGGGGTVNWSVSLQTQGFVRKEWAEEHGLPFFETAEYQAALDRVCKFMGVVSGDNVKQTHRGKVLLEGSRRLGWAAEVCPQNSGGAEHWCGHCHLGCGSGDKQGPAISWLPHAGRNGAKFVEGFAVEQILWDEKAGWGEKKAVGVRGTWLSRDAQGENVGPERERTKRTVVVKAKKVIVSAGTLNSPVILTKSGLTNPHIGSNLHLHPVNFLVAEYDEDVRPWEGGIITSVCLNFENLDGKGHGAKLEPTCMLPYAIMPHFPWRNGLDFKLSALRLRQMAGFISLARDRDTGRVFPDPVTGKPSMDYRVSAFDAAHVLEGIIGLAKICYITGARAIHPFLPGVEPFVREEAVNESAGVTDPAFTAWLAKLRSIGNSPPYVSFVSAHQMGTCRMSSHAGAGVVDPKGKVWGTEHLYVADASVFPSASGVNPMVTTMAIADGIARSVSKELKPQ
ncbi:hypothetical protein OQA88_376 [Cercophora sp. LCS_1]